MPKTAVRPKIDIAAKQREILVKLATLHFVGPFGTGNLAVTTEFVGPFGYLDIRKIWLCKPECNGSRITMFKRGSKLPGLRMCITKCVNCNSSHVEAVNKDAGLGSYELSYGLLRVTDRPYDFA